MRRIYDYNTKKLYESTDEFMLTVEEYDAKGNFVDKNTLTDRYSTKDDAFEDSYELMSEVAKKKGFNDDDVNYIASDNSVTFEIEGEGKWIFRVETEERKVDECGDNCNEEDDVNECGKTCNEDDVNECGDNCNEEDDVTESVTERFARLRKMFESEEEDEEVEDVNVEETEEKNSDENDNDKKDDDKKDDDDDKKDDDEDEDNDEDGDEMMKAVILTVNKGDGEKCKEELIAANIPEEDIEIIEGKEDDETEDIRIDVNSVLELKEYLEKKGIDLEKEIGGEIVDDTEAEEDTEDKNDGEDEGNDDEKDTEDEDEEEFNYEDLGDIFGAEEE